ncbi:MAG: class I SAM-dependent methyltransferase, partial [Acidobacteria bacterium]|nr:class I SAM-dependent methyltransferase [Acidobacteriota bacterium]
MTTTPTNRYNEVPYEGQPFAQTHPDRLATLGKLFRMTPAAVESCRVLELGCGEGANLIPMALALPGSEFIGIDSAARAIAKGQGTVNALDLGNIKLQHMDILDVPGDIGKFDYIITHGVYSWVPEPVRDKLMSIAREHLAPQGIAYISYNTYPGAHMRDMVREIMLFHAGQFPEPAEKLDQSRALLRFLADVQPPETDYGMVLRQEYEALAKRSGYALYHDELSESNAPMYFHQFVGHAMRHGLKY